MSSYLILKQVENPGEFVSSLEKVTVPKCVWLFLFSRTLGIIKVPSEFIFNLWLDFIQLIKIVLGSVSCSCLIFIIHWTTEDEVLRAFEQLKSCE